MPATVGVSVETPRWPAQDYRLALWAARLRATGRRLLCILTMNHPYQRRISGTNRAN